MSLAGIIVFSFIIAVAIVFFSMRTKAMRAHRRFQDKALAHLETWNLEPCSVRPEFQDLRPVKALGLLRFRVDIGRGGAFRWVHCCDTSMLFGCMKMHTLLFIPDPGYNLPMMSIDIIFAGKRRVFVIEIIDPAQIEDNYLKQHYQSMLKIKPPPDVMPEKEVAYWYKNILAECSIHTSLDAGDDELIFSTYCAYLDAYAVMTREARPAPGSASVVRGKQHWYVQSLIDHGGPAVDILLKLLGRSQGLAYIWSTMFGYDEQGTLTSSTKK